MPYSEGVGEWAYCAQSCSSTDAHLQTRGSGVGGAGLEFERNHDNKSEQHILVFTAGACTTHSSTHVIVHTYKNNTTNELELC